MLITGKNVGVPSEVVETMGRRKRLPCSNSCADILRTGVVAPEAGADDDAPDGAPVLWLVLACNHASTTERLAFRTK